MASDHDHHDDAHAEHGLGHIASAKSLAITFGLLMVFTALTVGATKVDLGANTNLALAMAIAVIKATLVVLFFMHLRYDKLFHSILLVGGILAASLFVGFTLMDSGQYQPSVHWNARTPLPTPDGPRVKAQPPL